MDDLIAQRYSPLLNHDNCNLTLLRNQRNKKYEELKKKQLPEIVVKRHFHRYITNTEVKDELISVADAALFMAIDRVYSNGSNIKIKNKESTYYSQCIKYEVRRYILKEHKTTLNVISLDNYNEDNINQCYQNEKEAIDQKPDNISIEEFIENDIVCRRIVRALKRAMIRYNTDTLRHGVEALIWRIQNKDIEALAKKYDKAPNVIVTYISHARKELMEDKIFLSEIKKIGIDENTIDTIINCKKQRLKKHAENRLKKKGECHKYVPKA